MKSFLARMVFRIDWEPQQTTPAFEIQLRLFIAPDKADAFAQANMTGHNEAGDFPFYRGGSVNWKFIGLTSLEEIGSIHSGMLLDSSQRITTSNWQDGERVLLAQIHRFNDQLEVETMSSHRVLVR